MNANEFVRLGICSLCLTLGLALNAGLVAQEGGEVGGTLNVDVIRTQDEVQGGGMAVIRLDDGNGVQEMQFSTLPSGTFELAAPMVSWSPSFGGDMSNMMLDPQVRSELELVDDQVEQLREIQQDFQKRMQEMVSFEPGQAPDVDRLRGMREKMKELGEEKKERIKDILLPHQSQRLEQISTQMRMKQMGDAAALSQGALADSLGIDEEQKERLKEKAKELQEKLEKDIARLKEKMRKELLGELTSDQRAQLEELMGDKFEHKPQPFSQRIRRLQREQDDDR